jgi:hypothetical protein
VLFLPYFHLFILTIFFIFLASSTCLANGLCRNYLYLGLTLATLIGIIVGGVVGFILLISLCICVCRSLQRPVITQQAYTAPVYYNPGAVQVPTNAPAGVSYKAQF